MAGVHSGGRKSEKVPSWAPGSGLWERWDGARGSRGVRWEKGHRRAGGCASALSQQPALLQHPGSPFFAIGPRPPERRTGRLQATDRTDRPC